MKKKLLALLLSMTMAGVMLAGCGKDKEEAPAEEPAPVEAVEEEAATTEETATQDVEQTTGFTFADLQTNYASMVEAYNAVEAAYMDDSVAQDDTVEELLKQTKDVMDQMGELTEDDFTSEQDLLDMNQSILDLLDALNGTLDLMKPADAGSSAEVTDEELKAAFPVGYAGAADDGSKVMWALSDTTPKGLFISFNAAGDDAVSICGDVVRNNDDTVTLTDDETGSSITLGIENTKDDEGTDCVILTSENGTCILYEVPGANVIDALLSIANS